MELSRLGWNDFFASVFEPYSGELEPARVVSYSRGIYRLLDGGGGYCTAQRRFARCRARSSMPEYESASTCSPTYRKKCLILCRPIWETSQWSPETTIPGFYLL